MPDDETILQNTGEGHEEIPVDEIPLSDAAGEGRLRRRKAPAEEPRETG